MKINIETSSLRPTPWQRAAKLLPWLVLVGGLGATWFLQQVAMNAAHQAKQASFDYQAHEIKLRIEQRLAAYKQILRGISGLFVASQQVEHNEFRDYAATLRISKNYPGIQGIGYALIIPPQEKAGHIDAIRKEGFPQYTVHPEGGRDLYTPIIYLEPFTGRNLRAFGYDLYSEPVRRAAMEQARDLDRVTITGKVRLTQETGQQVQAGFLMFLPIYHNNRPHTSTAERRANIFGWVFAPFRMDDLMLGILGGRYDEIDLEIFDGENAGPEALMYDSDHSLPLHQAHLLRYQTTQKIDIFGHSWTIKLRSTPAFEAQLETGHINVIRLTGVLLSALLSVLIGLLIHGRAMTRALQESEFRWKFALEGSGDGLWDWDVVGGTEFFSKRWKEMLGYADNEIGNDPDERERHIHPADMAGAVAAMQAYIDGKTPIYTSEHRVHCRDGSWKWMLDRGIVVNRTKAGEPLRMIGTRSDITPRKQWELELLESEKRFRIVADAAPVLIWLSDTDKLYYWFNKPWLAFTGRSPEQEQGNGWAEGVHPDDLQKCLGIYVTNFDVRQPFAMEYRLKRHDGEYRWIFDSGVPRMDEQGVFSGYIGSCIDITDNKQIQLDLQASEIRAKAALAELQHQKYVLDQHAIVATTDVRGTITYVNEKFCQISGYSEQELIGQNHRLLNSGTHPTEFFTAMFHTIAKGKTWCGEICNRAKDGSLYWVLTTIVPFLDSNRKPTQYIAIRSDITERMSANNKLKQALSEKEMLLKEVYHRVKNNLQVVSSLINLQARNVKNEAAADLLKQSADRIKAMALLHEKLYQSKDLAKIDFNTYIHSLVDHLLFSYGAHLGKIKLSMKIDEVFLDVDTAIPCGLIINELLTNALKHAFPDDRHGEIGITFTQDQGECILVITDNGIGFATGPDFNKTASLGLKLVATLTNQLTGQMTLDQSGGSTVTIRFTNNS